MEHNRRENKANERQLRLLQLGSLLFHHSIYRVQHEGNIQEQKQILGSLQESVNHGRQGHVPRKHHHDEQGRVAAEQAHEATLVLGFRLKRDHVECYQKNLIENPGRDAKREARERKFVVEEHTRYLGEEVSVRNKNHNKILAR